MTGDIAGLATALGVFIGACGLFVQARQRKLGLAQIYVQRYWEISDALLADRSSDNKGRYLALSEDEYDVARLGWIDAGVWSVWHPSIRKTAGEFAAGQKTGFTLLDSCLSESGAHEADRCPVITKRPRRRRAAWRLERLIYG